MLKGRIRRERGSVSNQNKRAWMVVLYPSELTLIRAKNPTELGKSAHSDSVYS